MEVRETMMDFVKIGNRIINPHLVTQIDLDSPSGEEPLEVRCVEVELINGSELYFYEEEAELVEQFFVSPIHTLDMTSESKKTPKSLPLAQPCV